MLSLNAGKIIAVIQAYYLSFPLPFFSFFSFTSQFRLITFLFVTAKARFKRRATAVPKSMDRIKFDFCVAVARSLKPSRATAANHGKLCRATRQWLELVSNVVLLPCTC